MASPVNAVSRYFSDRPDAEYACPTCKKGLLTPRQETFTKIEPSYSEAEHHREDWEPDWIRYRFTFTCVCSRKECGETAYVSGSGSVDRRYVEDDESEWYDYFRIRAFYPAPVLCSIPDKVSEKVASLLENSFSLYWVDVSAAANALRASLENLLDELQIPRTEKKAKGTTFRISLHRRLELWSKKQEEYAELCFALKEVGNLGSHGESVHDKHYFAALEIYGHVLAQLYENDAERMKELAKKIRSELKGLLGPL